MRKQWIQKGFHSVGGFLCGCALEQVVGTQHHKENIHRCVFGEQTEGIRIARNLPAIGTGIDYLMACLLCQQILLVAPPPMKRGAWVTTDALVSESIYLAEEYKSLAEKLNITFVDTRHWNIELTFDGVHFTEEGHHSFAENLGKELRL